LTRGGRPLLEQTISAQSAVTEIERIVVVLGAHADALLARVRFVRAESVRCPGRAVRGPRRTCGFAHFRARAAAGEAVDRGRRRNVA
jgi:hypothetical protein